METADVIRTDKCDKTDADADTLVYNRNTDCTSIVSDQSYFLHHE